MTSDGGTRAALLCLSCVALSGCPSLPPVASLATIRAAELPNDLAELTRMGDTWEGNGDTVSLENSLVVREHALSLTPRARSYELLWRSARVACELADAARSEGEKRRRAKFAEKARTFAAAAVAIDPKGAAGHYYLGEALGLVASTRSLSAIDLLPKMVEQLKLAVASDEKLDHAGPHRLLGALYTKAPSWPTSVGDVDEGLTETRRAVELDGDFPPNHLYYGEALNANDKHDEARAELEKVMKATPPVGDELRAARWRADAAEALARIRR